MSAPTLFDYAMQNQGGKRSMKFLEEMKAYIPYEEIEKILIEEGVYRPKRAGRAGRPPFFVLLSPVPQVREEQIAGANTLDTHYLSFARGASTPLTRDGVSLSYAVRLLKI